MAETLEGQWGCGLNVVFVAIATGLLTSQGQAQLPNLDAPHHPEHILVRFNPGTSDEAIDAVNDAVGGVELRRFQYLPGLLLVQVADEPGRFLTGAVRKEAFLTPSNKVAG